MTATFLLCQWKVCEDIRLLLEVSLVSASLQQIHSQHYTPTSYLK